MRCAAKTKGGSRCRLDATHGSYCYQHAPETEGERRRNASRGGRAGGNGRGGAGEVAQAKGWVKGLVAKMLRGEVDRGDATAAFMGINTLARLIELERKIREQDELEQRIAELESYAGEATENRSRSWGR